MQSSCTLVWCFVLVAGALGAIGQADEPPQLPAQYKGFVITAQTWFAYDAKHDVLYLMKSGSERYKLARGK